MAVAARVLNITKIPDFRSDKSLIRAAQAGEKEAAATLISKYYPRVFSFLTYLTNSAKAEDLTQEVFAKALGALGRFNGRYQFEPWLLRIAKNLVIDESRRDVHRALPADPNDLPELEPVDAATDRTWESVAQSLDSNTVKRALMRLPERQRAALVLREIEGLSYTQIAEIVGTNVRGAEATLRRARARFRMEAAAAESFDSLDAICRKTLRTLATEGSAGSTKAEVSRHLRTCSECRSRAARMGSADRMLGALPPLAVTSPTWIPEVLGSLRAIDTKPRGILEILRNAPQEGLTSPLAHALEAFASVAVAGMVAMASIAQPPMQIADVSREVAYSPPAVSVDAEYSSASALPIHSELTAETALPPVTLPSDQQPGSSQKPTNSSPQVTNQTGPQYAVNRITDKVDQLTDQVTSQVPVPPVISDLTDSIKDATHGVVKTPEVKVPEAAVKVPEVAVETPDAVKLPQGDPVTDLPTPAAPKASLPRKRLFKLLSETL